MHMGRHAHPPVTRGHPHRRRPAGQRRAVRRCPLPPLAHHPVHEDPARRPSHGLKPGPPGVRARHDGAGFVDEHNRNAASWDLVRLTAALGNELTWDIAGGALDPCEPRPIRAASQRLDPTLVRIHDLPGLTTSEHLNLLADLIHALPRPRLTRPWAGRRHTRLAPKGTSIASIGLLVFSNVGG
jgi:hypothetical protein